MLTATEPVKQAYDALLGGHSVEDLATAADIQLSTAWSYICKAAELLTTSERNRVAETLLPRDLWRALLSLRNDTRVGGKLLDLLPIVERRLSPRSEFLYHEHRISMLRLGRLCMA